jgi:signal transduction histidine kinase
MKHDKKIGPSVTEIKLRSDVDRLRRELTRLKKTAVADSSAKAAAEKSPELERSEVSPELMKQIADLEQEHERLANVVSEQLERDRLRTEKLHEVLKVLGRLGGDVELVTHLQRIAEAIRAHLGFRIVLVRVKTAGTDHLKAVAFTGLRPSARAELEAEDVSASEFQSWLKPDFCISHSYFISHDEEFSKLLPAGHAQELDARTDGEWHSDDVLLVPFYDRTGESLGYFSVDDPSDRRVPPRETVEMLEMFASHAAAAIENARLVGQIESRRHELEALNDRMKEMAALKDQFVQTISHELRTPLASIRAYLDTLLASWPDGVSPDQSRHFLGVINEESIRLSRLVESVLDLSRFDSGQAHLHRGAMDLGEVVEEAAALLQPMAQAGAVHLKVVNALADTRVDADRDQMRQLVLHLGSNAVKFTPTGGTVRLHLTGDERGVTLRVEDTGIGIPPEQLERIFDRFYQVDSSTVRRFGGTGLGLSISRAIVEAHGGKIVATSTPDQGSCFTVMLKRHAGPRVLMNARSDWSEATQNVIRLAVEMVSEAMDAGTVSLMAFEPEGDLVIRAAIGVDPWVVRETRIRSGVGVAGWVAEHRRPVCVRPEDGPTVPIKGSGRRHYRSGTFLSVPLEGESGLLGVLNVTDPGSGRSFDAEDSALLLDLTKRVARAWQQAGQVERERAQVEGTTDALRVVLQHLKDGRQHAPHRVRLAQALARELKMSEEDVHMVGFAATVHDIGMTQVRADVLGVRGPLTPDQRAEVERHVERGVELLRPLEAMGVLRDIVLSHHEWWDGTGYPRGLSGADIALGARVLSVVDAFESMTQGRVHRAPMSRQAALNEIVRLAGRQFDPDVVDAIEHLLPRLELDDSARSPGDAPSGAATRR